MGQPEAIVRHQVRRGRPQTQLGGMEMALTRRQALKSAGAAVAAAGIAKILFYLFVILFLVTLMGHLLRRS